MSKIKCKVFLKENSDIVINNEYFLGIKQNDKISYKENNILVTIFHFENKIMMKRISNDYEINLEFIEKNSTNGKYFLNSCNLLLPLEIFTDKILVNEEMLEIDYQLNDQNYSFKIEYEVIE